jgi:hypothetical protein
MAELRFENVDKMSPEEEDAFFDAFLSELQKEDDSAVRANLAAGFPVYYRHSSFPDPEHLVKEYPSGRMELITMSDQREENLIKVLRP